MRILDLFCGEGGAGMGYARAGFELTGVENVKARANRYPFDVAVGDALDYLQRYGTEFDAIHASPPCTGYSRATTAIPDRLERYDRLIAITRELLVETGRPYVIENVYDAYSELKGPKLLCGRQFDLHVYDDDGTYMVLDRHRWFETNWELTVPKHYRHKRDVQVAGSYRGARRNKVEARNVRKGGYVPSLEKQKELIGVPWMTQVGCWGSIPPVYTKYIGNQLKEIL